MDQITISKTEFYKLFNSIQRIQSESGDNLDRSGQYTSDRLGVVLDTMEKIADSNLKSDKDYFEHETP